MNVGMVWVLVLPKFINLGLKFILGSTPPGSCQTPASPHLHPFALILMSLQCSCMNQNDIPHHFTNKHGGSLDDHIKPYLRQSCGDSPNISCRDWWRNKMVINGDGLRKSMARPRKNRSSPSNSRERSPCGNVARTQSSKTGTLWHRNQRNKGNITEWQQRCSEYSSDPTLLGTDNYKKRKPKRHLWNLTSDQGMIATWSCTQTTRQQHRHAIYIWRSRSDACGT